MLLLGQDYEEFDQDLCKIARYDVIWYDLKKSLLVSKTQPSVHCAFGNVNICISGF